MALRGLFSKKPPAGSKPAASKSPGRGKKGPSKPRSGPLDSLFSKPLELSEKKRERLLETATQGARRFSDYNKNRVELAFLGFDEPMKQALFDIIYLLAVNDPGLAEMEYTTTEVVDNKQKEVKKVADLYVPDAPHGVAGLEALPEVIKEPFLKHIEATFGHRGLPPGEAHCPIMGLFSIGSIGTVGHKTLASDLDLQIFYRLEPFLMDPKGLGEEALKGYFTTLLKYLAKKVQKQNKIPTEQLTRNPNLAGKVQQLARAKAAKAYPLLYRYFAKKEASLIERALNDAKARKALIDEAIKLRGAAIRLTHKAQITQAENKLRLKIDRIQTYVASRYPAAEIWLFPMSEEDMKQGNFRSTLESKESSGSAYELILTYDTLMPGVYFTPVMPSHFLFDSQTNNDASYEQMMGYLRAGLLDPVLGEFKHALCDQGRTPDLSQDYVGGHNGAIYWEAFKASSGNLPKALMNLMRYETLLCEATRPTMIQLIKQPERINDLADRINSGVYKEVFLPTNMLAIEKEFPQLVYDPWWTRYKVLKIAYLENLIEEVSDSERIEISHILDLAFALHVRISDVFTLQKPETHRQKVLCQFLKLAFPEGSSQRRELEAISIGDINEVTQFEKGLRTLFKRCINRIAKRLDAQGIQDEREVNQEFLIWYHYYKKNFEPQENVIQPTILQHLAVPRGRVLAGFEKHKGWFFRAFQKQRRASFGEIDSLLNHLPEETTLIEGTTFLKGLGHCIANGYYGVINQGTLKESHTALELVGTHMDLGDEVDNEMAYVQPGQIDQLMRQIQAFFPHQKVDYRACLQEELRITEVFICLNLLHFGQVSFLFRNNLGSLVVEERELAKFHAKAKHYHQNYKEVYQDKDLHREIESFFEEHKIEAGAVKLWIWVNANSFETHHPLTNQARKEQDLTQEFRAAVLERLLSPYQTDHHTRYENPDNLKRTVFCAALVAAIDGDVSKKEYRHCTEYLDGHWQSRWGDEEEAFTTLLKDLKHFVSAGSQLHKNIQNLAHQLPLQLTLGQQQATLALMRKMVLFDQKNLQNKEEVVRSFEQAFDLPYQDMLT